MVLIRGAGGHGNVVADILCCAGVPVLGFLDDDPAIWGATRDALPVLGGIATYRDHRPGGLILGMGDRTARATIVERLGDNVRDLWTNAIHPRATVARSVRMGSCVAVMAGAFVNTGATVDHECTIGDHAHIGPGAHVAGGIRVGRGALIGIGAGSVVPADFPAHITGKGVPARP